jgi:hypothetical protein
MCLSTREIILSAIVVVAVPILWKKLSVLLSPPPEIWPLPLAPVRSYSFRLRFDRFLIGLQNPLAESLPNYDSISGLVFNVEIDGVR